MEKNLQISGLSQVEEAMMVMEDDSPMEAASTPSTPRNLSAWSISIPYIDFYDDDVKRERIPVFCIDVERNDRKAGMKIMKGKLEGFCQNH